MTKLFAALAGAICIGLMAPVAQAAPLAGAASASSSTGTSEIIRVHGLHSSCKLDRGGWHRSHIWGRERCAPPRWHKHHHHHHGKKHWKKKH